MADHAEKAGGGGAAPPSPVEQSETPREARSPDGRLQMVLLSAQGMDAAAITKIAFTSEDHVRRCMYHARVAADLL
jgi:hypothetical protein